MIVRRNLPVMLPLIVAQSAVYVWLNLRVAGRAQEMPLSWLDANVPFWSWTVWPYLTLALAEALLPLMIRSRPAFRELLIAAAICLPILDGCLFAFPTTYPRPPAPTDDTATGRTYRLLTVVDGPGCCCPSGHVLLAALAFWAAWRDRLASGWVLWPVFALLTATVLTTKQHYLWDILAALALAAFGLAVTSRLAVRRPPLAPDTTAPL